MGFWDWLDVPEENKNIGGNKMVKHKWEFVSVVVVKDKPVVIEECQKTGMYRWLSIPSRKRLAEIEQEE